MKLFGKRKKVKPITLNFLFEKYKPVFNEIVNINFHKIFPIKSDQHRRIDLNSSCSY